MMSLSLATPHFEFWSEPGVIDSASLVLNSALNIFVISHFHKKLFKVIIFKLFKVEVYTKYMPKPPSFSNILYNLVPIINTSFVLISVEYFFVNIYIKKIYIYFGQQPLPSNFEFWAGIRGNLQGFVCDCYCRKKLWLVHISKNSYSLFVLGVSGEMLARPPSISNFRF